jgi:hypothetical protein
MFTICNPIKMFLPASNINQRIIENSNRSHTVPHGRLMQKLSELV